MIPSIAGSKSPEAQRWSPAPPTTFVLSSSLPKSSSSPKGLTDSDDVCAQVIVLSRTRSASDGPLRAKLHLALIGAVVHLNDDFGEFKIVALKADDGSALDQCRISARTQLFIAYIKYNVVIAIDISSSMATASNRSVLFQDGIASVCRLLQILYEIRAAFRSSLMISEPSTFVSIVACDHANVVQAIVHNADLDSIELDALIDLFKSRFFVLESQLVSSANSESCTINDAAFMIACTLLAHDRMPLGRCPITFMVTDGVLSAPDIGTFDSVFASIAAKDIAIHTVLIDTPTSYFGFVPDSDFLDMTAQYSGGMSLSSDELLIDSETYKERNLFLLLLPSAITRAISPKPSISSRFCLKVKEYLVDVGVGALIACRIKEGFKNGRLVHLEPSGFAISLLLVWKPIITVEYTVEMRDQENPRVSLKVIAPDEFLRKLQIQQKSKKHRGPPVTINTGSSMASHPLLLLERLSMIVKTDQLLVLLHCIRPSDVTPHLTQPNDVQNGSANHNQGSSCLAKLISLPPNMWKRWMTVFSLDIVCQHPHPYDQQGPGSESLFEFVLRKWCSSLHGKVFIKQLADNSNSLTDDRLRSSYWRGGHRRPLPLCFARVFWITSGLAYLYIGFTTVDTYQIESELQLLKDLLQNCTSMDRSQEPCVVFPFLPLSPVLLRLDPSDVFFRPDVALDDARTSQNALTASPPMSPTALSRSVSTPDLHALTHLRMSNSTPKTSPTMRTDIARDAVEVSLPKIVLRFFMRSCQRTYRIQNHRTLTAFFKVLNHARVSDGFRQICSDELSCSYFTDIEIIADRRANLQFALCKLSETDMFVEIWLDPDEPCSQRLRSDSDPAAELGDYFDNIVDWLDTYDCHCLQALQAFHAIVDVGTNSGNRPFCVKDGNSLFQYKSQSRLSCSPMGRFSTREIPFDIVPLLHCARPCIVPLRFPTGMPANQSSVLSSLEHIRGLIPVLPGICYAQIINQSFITLVVLSPEAGSQAAKHAPAQLGAFLDLITGYNSDSSPNTATVVIFEVNIDDIIQYRLPIKSPLTDPDCKFTPVFTPKASCVEKRSCSHSSELNNLRQKLEQAHATNFVRTIYGNVVKGEHVSEIDLRTALQSCTQFRDNVDLTEFAGADSVPEFQHDLQIILQEYFRSAAPGSPYFALMKRPASNDGVMSDDNIDEDTSLDSSNLLPTPPNSPDAADFANLPFFCLFEIVSKHDVSSEDSVVPVVLPADFKSAFLSESSQISLRLTAFMLPSRQTSNAPPSRPTTDPKSRIRKSMSLSSFPRSPTLRSAMSRQDASITEIHRFTSLPSSLRKCMARVTKLIRSAFCNQMLHCLYIQLSRPLSEKEASTVIRYLDYLRPPAKHQTVVELDFIQCAGVTRSPLTMLMKLLQESLSLQAVSDSCYLVAVESFAFLSVCNSNINIVVHGNSNLLSSIEKITQSCLHRVTQLMLLESLHVTRTASPLLISDDDAKFACPRVFTKELKLHPRLNPSAALQTLNDTALHPFVLGNRHFVYVYQQSNGAIFYMRLALSNAALFLELYGVDQPDDEACTHLSYLLGTSVSALALAQIAALLSRNQHFRWTQADLLLIRPEGSLPKATIRFELPFPVRRKTFSFLLRMAQTFTSSSLLSALRCADPIVHSERLHWSWSDFSFVHNYDAQFSSSKLVDNGIALVFGSLLSADGETFRLHRCCMDDSEATDFVFDGQIDFAKPVYMETVPGGISQMQFVAESHQPPEEHAVLSIIFEIWALGSIDIHQLIGNMSRLFSHAVYDFLLEGLWRSTMDHIPKLEALKKLSEVTHSDQNPALHLSDVSFRLATWSLAVITSDLQAMISSINENMQVSMYVCDSGCWRPIDFSRHEDFRITRAILFASISKLPSLQYHPHVFASDVPFTNAHFSKTSILVERFAFVVVDISRTQMQIIAYNFRTSLSLQLVKQTLRLASWCRFRLHLLDHILHQKLGLFWHLSSTSPPPVTSTNDVAVNPAKFTVENVEVLISNKAPPRHAIQESSKAVFEPRHNSGPLADRRRTLNRFESNRHRTHSVRTATTVLSPNSSTPSAFPFATLLRGQSPPDDYIGFSKRETVEDPLCRHGQSYLLISKRIRDEKELELQRKFCLEICESGLAPAASISSHLQWIDLICTHSMPLSRPPYYSPPMFVFCGGNADFMAAAIDVFVGEFAAHISEFDYQSLIMVKQDSDGVILHRCLFRKVVEQGLICLIHLSVRPSKIICDGYLYESTNGTASVEHISATSTLFNQNIDAPMFTLRFHVSYLFALLNQERSLSMPSSSLLESIDLRSTFAVLSAISGSGLCRLPLPVRDAETYSYLITNANRFGYRSSHSFVFNSESVAFSFKDVFVQETARSSVLQNLEAISAECHSELSRQRIWRLLQSGSSSSAVFISKDDLSLLNAIELHHADPALNRMFRCLSNTESVPLLDHLKQTFPNICSELTFSGDPKQGLFIEKGHAGVMVVPQSAVPLISCGISNNVSDERKALYADVVNAICMYLWRRVILD